MIRSVLVVLLLGSGALAQQPAIGVIEVFGLHHVSEARVRESLGLREGDPLPESKEAVERRMARIPGVRAVHVEGACCVDSGKYVLWLGVEEKGSPAVRFRAAPTGAIRLPAGILHLSRDLDSAITAAVQSGRSENDIVDGRSFIRDPASRAIQEQFIPYAAAHLALLRDVLHQSSDAEHRAIAAQVIAYGPDVRAVIPDLIEALRDPSSDVRNDATRALLIIAAYALQHPEAGIHVPAESFVALLASPYWTDRNKSSGALAQLTANRDPQLLKTLRSRALPPLVEMARWKLIGYAAPSLRILGRIGGMSDHAIEQAIDLGDRETIIASAKRR